MHRYRPLLFMSMAFVVAAPPVALPADRDTLVRNDRQSFEDSPNWIYNDLAEAVRQAKAAGKPLLVVFRCVPCEACQEFDDLVARRDRKVGELMDQFVCVRIVQANAINLDQFRYDFDLSFAAVLMHPDGDIYGRFGTRSRHPEAHDISLDGLREALAGALELHRRYDDVKPALAAKRPMPDRFHTPRDYPLLSGKYQAELDYEGRVAASCIHCHQIRDAQRRLYRDSGEAMPEQVLFPNPNPAVVGLVLDPRRRATVTEVDADSAAERAGLRPGDELLTIDGQPLLSIADVQWVLQQAPAAGELAIEARRGGKPLALSLTLDKGWRRRDDLSWRATTWELRRMALGGMWLVPLTADERRQVGLTEGLSLRVKHLGEHGDHATALKAGVRKGDILISFDGLTDDLRETDLLAHGIVRRRKGDRIEVVVLRDGERKRIRFDML